jgi:hypothetical protein
MSLWPEGRDNAGTELVALPVETSLATVGAAPFEDFATPSW